MSNDQLEADLNVLNFYIIAEEHSYKYIILSHRGKESQPRGLLPFYRITRIETPLFH